MATERKFRSRYDYEGDEVADATITYCPEPSLTKQEFKDESDINVVMRRYQNSGIAPGASGVARYGDFSDAVDYHTASNIVLAAEEQFSRLPSKIRDRFRNDPAAFLDFVHDSKNLDEAAELGLLSDEVMAARARAAATAPPAVPAAPAGG